MKMKLLIIFLYFFGFVSSAFAQTNESEKITEFGLKQCGQLAALVDGSFQYFQKEKNAKFYVIYYEGKKFEYSVFNRKTQKYDKFTEPVRGYALNRAKEIILLIKRGYKPKKGQIVLIDGGFKEELLFELWIVPKSAAPPKLTPTVSEKDMKFSKGKPPRVRDCAKAYDGY
jgi:hypothetical protein